MDYTIDNLTNRYTDIAGSAPACDAAGNLKTDYNSYAYEYDYENRITKITKDSNDIAEFAYDALGRRIWKRDAVADTNNIYYYNDKWQVLCDYNDSGNLQAWFAYGNYIDEALITGKWFTWNYMRYYVHDHVYSPVALTNHTGVLERYEYDSYGNCHIMDASYNPRSTSSYANPYYFQGKRLDLLSGGDLELMHWPYRDYSTYLGRWLQSEKLGMIPNDAESRNPFNPLAQYTDGLSLYQCLASNPVSNTDTYGTRVRDWIPGVRTVGCLWRRAYDTLPGMRLNDYLRCVPSKHPSERTDDEVRVCEVCVSRSYLLYSSGLWTPSIIAPAEGVAGIICYYGIGGATGGGLLIGTTCDAAISTKCMFTIARRMADMRDTAKRVCREGIRREDLGF